MPKGINLMWHVNSLLTYKGTLWNSTTGIYSIPFATQVWVTLGKTAQNFSLIISTWMYGVLRG